MPLKTKGEVASRVRVRDRLLLSLDDVSALVSLAPGTIVRMVRENVFVRPVTVSGRRYWRSAEVFDWIAAGLPPGDEWVWAPTESATMLRLVNERRSELSSLDAEQVKTEKALGPLRKEYRELSAAVRDRKRLLHATGAAAV